MTAWPGGALADAAEAGRRAARLDGPHMRALSAYVRALRAQGGGAVPDFDPEDGGTGARLLLLLEKPGPRLAGPHGAGFVSRDNDTGTARAIAAFMREAGVPRSGTVIWNIVPWWNGRVAVRAAEARAGAAALRVLLPLLPDLRCAVLAGRTARDHGRSCLADRGVEIFTCVHPSPQCRAGPATSADWARLPAVWRAAWRTCLERDARASGMTPNCDTNQDP